MEHVESVVVGAGVVGLAVARALALAGREVLVLEAEAAIGTGTSARNSEVIHAGIYYPAGSLKARLCVAGKQLLYDYAQTRGIAHQRLGKLIVATEPEQLPQLRALAGQGAANGVHDLQWLEADALARLEPQLRAVAALLSPSTGIVDSHALMLALQGDLEQAGGQVVCHTALVRARVQPDDFVLEMADGCALGCRLLVNAAGLQAPALAAQFEGLAAQLVPATWWAKGSYFVLSGRTPFQRLVYPVPEAGGLGVHYTLDLGGQARFGPDVQWVTDSSDLTVEPSRAELFSTQVRRYWPALPEGALQPAYAGMRPKLSGPDMPAADFVIQGPADHGLGGLVNLFGIESPGLTSALAIAAQVAQLLQGPAG